jgi:NAD(P)-dependent dehydrogenase (short-subunit alcohol dehydrogenase family)
MRQTPDLAGRVALVSGASRGVGRAIAMALAAHGARVALVARGTASLEAARREIETAGGTARAFPADVADPADVLHRLKPAVEQTLGPPSILINGAGIYGPVALIADGDPVAWLRTMQVNLCGAYMTCRAFVGDMIAAGWGRVVNVSSAAALHPPGPLTSAYYTSKIALNAMTRSLAAELAGTGVTANVIHPGDIKTDMWREIRDAAGRLGPEGASLRDWAAWVDQTGGDPPEKAAALVLRLLCEEGAAINGQFLWIEGGLQAPGEMPWS